MLVKCEYLRVPRQGLEPRTRGLRVRCFVRFSSSTSYHSVPRRAVTCRTVRQTTSAGAVWCRLLPGRTATSEQTWSKHGRWSFAQAADTVRNTPCQRGSKPGAFPAPRTVLKIVTDRTS